MSPTWRRHRSTLITIAVLAVVTVVLVRFGGGQVRFRRDHVVSNPSATWDWSFFFELLPDFGRALWVTVQGTLGGFVVAITLGLLLAIGRRSQARLVRWPVGFVIEFIRSTPLLIQLYFIFFALPEFGVVWSPIVSLVVGLGVHYATYCSEAYRAGINSVPDGQWEASVALSLPPATTWGRVVLPQAIPNVLPALGNYLIAAFKDAPLAATIQVTGIVFFARTIQNRNFRALEVWTMVGIGFLLVSIPAAFLLRRLEKRIGYERT